MASFDKFFPTLLGFEGGFVDDPDDPGGATNKGITMQTFSACARRLLGMEPTLANLKALTDQQAGKIYKPLYWDKVRGDDIALQDLADIVFDFYVNAGGNATRLLQRVINAGGADPSVAVDGVIGSLTIEALETLDQKDIYRRYKSGRIAYYQDLAADHPSLAKFLKGWLNRVNAFPDL
ncbi:MAG TPA: glycosyl hydrolase 108 family protein [Candidatus Methylomirabilis sp.]|nr:glycosyl hydrolase 108 family protein [Candidatus Methylomirabilis sp.]